MADQHHYDTGEHEEWKPWQVRAGILIVVGIIGGMTGSMLMLIYDGLLVSGGREPASYEMSSYFSHYAPVIMFSLILTILGYLWAEMRYRASQRQNDAE